MIRRLLTRAIIDRLNRRVRRADVSNLHVVFLLSSNLVRSLAHFDHPADHLALYTSRLDRLILPEVVYFAKAADSFHKLTHRFLGTSPFRLRL
jgi:hypothetical protein